MKDDLREQIAALRAEVRQLSESFVNLRDEDVRKVFSDQAFPVLAERIDRSLDWPGSTRNAACRSALMEWLERCMGELERGGRAGALRYLEGHSARSAVDACGATGMEGLADDLESQVRSYIDLFGRVSGPCSRDRSGLPGELDPARAQAALGPLTNATRLEVLQQLAREDDGLASLSRALGLQKGHLQFHLRSLLDGGYIIYDRKSRLYSLSLRGRRALHGLARLMDELEDRG